MGEEICRRRWKSLRDTYQREKREQKECSSVPPFLDPCITPRETSGNTGRRAVEVRIAEYREEERAEAAAGPSHRAVDK
ncbi:hypothetical protein EYF80_013188 [Liparis tanakae]|uniref:MADF domain-containing protein n=1 Tax=Liparis tanakae TaxID=230148 RepID=A0A4Z2IEX5_9TELE|nr:hypothetical protein EYF80_013188 [Liparis tanakae]